ncbi:MAG TPA: pilin [Candidatus Microsaccharimonas sp.]|nr:pilin [Candidatus Microsaccharimonas sp.]
MLKKIKNALLSVGVFSLLAIPVLAPAVAYADITSDLCSGSSFDTSGNGTCNQDSNNGAGIDTILKKVIQIFSIIVGFVAVVMIIVGGIKYITSGGNDSSVAGAKNTIIYAVIGLIIVALSQVLVHYVLNNVANATNG